MFDTREYQRKKIIVSNWIADLPRLVRVPTPPRIRNAAWFNDLNLGKRLRVYAFPAFNMGIFSGKIFPAWGIYCMDEEKFEGIKIVRGATSGNFGKDFAWLLGYLRDIPFEAVVNYGTPEGKLKHLRDMGASIVEAPKGIPSTDYVYQLPQSPEVLIEDQYTHPGSITGWKNPMRHIMREMQQREEGFGFNFVAVTGTCSTLMAAKEFLKDYRPQERPWSAKVKILGVASMSKKEKVPGSRSYEDILELEALCGWPFQPEWEGVLDFPLVQSVTKDEAEEHGRELRDETMQSIGPTGALADAGIYHLIREHAENGTLEELMSEREEFIFCELFMDSRLLYI